MNAELFDPARHAALQRSGLLDPGPQPALDRLTRLAARLLEAPVAMINALDDHSQTAASCHAPESWGGARTSSLCDSLCRLAVSARTEVQIRDARVHPDTAESSLVTRHGVVSYIGIPLIPGGGHVLGTICAADFSPRTWTPEQVMGLRDLAACAEAELERRMDEQRVRLASLRVLIGGVAHELNNPLTTIKSFAQLMLLDPQPEEQREALEIVRREADRAARIVSDLRLLTRHAQERDPTRVEIDLNSAVEQVLLLRGHDLRAAGVAVATDLAPDLPPVLGEPGQLEQVLLTLVADAEHAMKAALPRKALTIRTEHAGSAVRLTVADTGPEIATEHRKRLFDPFFTSRSQGEGTGLGLALVHGIVTEHGGWVEVDSGPGGGAEFRITLPLPVRGHTARAAPAEPPEAPPTPIRLLVVDDEVAIRAALARYMRRRGHRIDEAADGLEALDRLSEAEYDAVLTDLRMPGLGGEQLYDELRKRGAEGLLIFMTGDAGTADTAAALERMGSPVVSKPFDLSAVSALVERHAATRRGE